jgi:homoserine kinase
MDRNKSASRNLYGEGVMTAFTYRVPATTANLGAGFDALSLALDRYLTITVEPAKSLSVETRGLDSEMIPTTADNLIVRVARSVAARRKRELPSFRLVIDNQIPLARGLGSSAAAIIAGISCYEGVVQDRLTDQELFKCAFEFESHPDNLAGALYGGLAASATATDGSVLVSRLKVAQGIRPIVVMPAFELSTEKARAVLPQTYSRKDAVFNIQRSALTIASLTTGNWPLLREAMRDRIHQPYRAPLIPGLDEILSLDVSGLLGVALSGAGPTVLAFARNEDAESISKKIAAVFDKHGVAATPYIANIDTEGRLKIAGNCDGGDL